MAELALLGLTVHDLLFLITIASSVALGAVPLLRPPRDRIRIGFSLGMLGFAVEGIAGMMLLRTQEPDDRLLWLRVFEAASLVLLMPWGLFVAGLDQPGAKRLSGRWRVGLGGVGACVVAGILAVSVLPAFDVSEIPGPFHAVRVDRAGQAAVVVEMLGTVTILAGLEACFRRFKRNSRWRMKYLALGVGGIFLVRFYLLSHVLLFHVLMAVYVTTAAATQLVGNLAIALSLARDRGLGPELTVSRSMMYRSVVVGVLGTYLVVIGALGWLGNRLGIQEEMFWGSLVVFVSALGLAALLFSEDVRWRVKRFISLHFYRSKYDYREQWMEFTARLGSLLKLEEVAPPLLGTVTAAVGTTQAVLYVASEREGYLRLAGAVGVSRVPPILTSDSALIASFGQEGRPNGGGATLGDPPLGPELTLALGDGAVAVPLRWRGSLIGLLLVGPERTGARYTPEDHEFLTTVGKQAAGAIMTARLSETVAQAREFEAFHRLTSFVIHDLKNSVSALSMLGQNALAHFEDPEFQRDAIKTLAGTVERMKGLLGKLSTTPGSTPLRVQPVPLSDLVDEAVRPFERDRRECLVKDLTTGANVSADPEAMLRVLHNLLGNAIEALDGEGTVTVKTYEEPGSVVISVSDTGCGIPEEFLRNSLFAPFRSTKKGGWGIGLYHSKEIVDAHGGRIEVASREGVGTTFWVKMPPLSTPVDRAEP
jgi:putative PEP-CTERM system histidine kinase